MKLSKLKKQNQLKRGLVVAALLLLAHSSLAQRPGGGPPGGPPGNGNGQGNQNNQPSLGITLTLQELPNTPAAPPCKTVGLAAKVARDLGNDAQLTGQSVFVMFVPQIKGEKPYCTESAEFIAGGGASPFLAAGLKVTWTLTQQIKNNAASPVQFGSANSYDAGVPSGVTLTSLRTKIDNIAKQRRGQGQGQSPRGVFVVLFAQGSGSRLYGAADFGGYFACFPSCQGCTGPLKNQCSACKPFASIQGATIDPALAGECLCSTGGPNLAGTACRPNGCFKSCKRCSGPGKNKCIECKDDYDPGPTLAGGLKECLKNRKETLKVD